MDIVDRDLERAERDASPERFPDSFPSDAPKSSKQVHAPQDGAAKVGRRDTTASLGSTASSSSASIVREPIGMSRINTQRDLDRHPTELDRIETHRTQHGSTVGRTITSRKSKKPLPKFGGGKVRKHSATICLRGIAAPFFASNNESLTWKSAQEYPPDLPAQEEYVVEFDGPDDRMHPQNWRLRKK